MAEIDHEYTKEPVCPYCGHVHQDAWEWLCDSEEAGIEVSGDHECDSCGESFEWRNIVTIDYVTKKPKSSTDKDGE